MSEKPEALRLADALMTLFPSREDGERAAAELRRLHQFAEDQIGRATAAEAALQMTKATHALKLSAVEAQRDALLDEISALREVLLYSLDNQGRYRKKHRKIVDAAIKAVEGEKT